MASDDMSFGDWGFGYREYVLDRLAIWRQAGHRVALVTVVGIDGGSPRPLGSQMAVRDDGQTLGLVTGGCAEHAIIQEAMKALEAGVPHIMRFGHGSPYLDIRLPCGSSLDLRFDPEPDDVLVAALLDAHTRRKPALLVMPLDGGPLQVWPADQGPVRPERRGGCLLRPYRPSARLMLAGRGPITSALALHAALAGMAVKVFTPDEDVRRRLAHSGVEIVSVQHPDEVNTDGVDEATALVLMFHDHEWEPDILARALMHQPFYIGALGSKATHASRLNILADLGVEPQLRARVRGPVGLAIGAEGPGEIALAVMGDIVAERRKVALPPL